MKKELNKYQSLIDNLPDAFAYHQVVADKTGKPVDYIFLEINCAFEEMTGLKRVDVIGKKVTEVLPDIGKDSFDWIGTYGRVALSGEPVRFESYFSPLARWYDISAYSDEHGYFGVIFHDLTERVRAEKNLKAEQQEKELILNNLSEQVTLLDQEMRIVWINAQVERRHNMTAEQFIGQKCFDAFHSFTEPCPDCPILDVFKLGISCSGIHKSPDNHYWQVSGTPIYDENEKVIGVLDTALDVTDLVVAEKSLQKSESRFQRVLKVIPDMVSVHDRDMNIVYSNWSGFGAVPPEKQVLNTKCYKTYRGYDQVCPDCRAISVFESKEMIREEVELSEDNWVELRVIPILDDKGEVEYFVEWVRDINAMKKIENQLIMFNIELENKVKERTAQLEISNRELDAFSYSVSHDLRAPLNRIDGFSPALLEDYSDCLDRPGQDYLRRIRNSSQHMAELIEDLLKLSRVTRQEINSEPVELSVLVNVYLKELQAKEPQRAVEAVITPGLVVEGDTALLRIALYNLLDNAWKFTREAEKARIEFGMLKSSSGYNTYYVRDNGAGFDMEHADKLFSSFQRLHSSTEYPGTGIGLSIVSRIIHRHGGKIWAEGEMGKGSTFYFTMP